MVYDNIIKKQGGWGMGMMALRYHYHYQLPVSSIISWLAIALMNDIFYSKKVYKT
jgi:hypothetical protein